MCLLIYKPQNSTPNWGALKEGFLSNRDSAGFAVRHAGSVWTSKAFWTYESFRLAFERFSEHQAVIHFRIATHGGKTESNCHPFDVGHECPWAIEPNKLVVAHNGILPYYNPKQPDVSDTRQFIRSAIGPRVKGGNVRALSDHKTVLELLAKGSRVVTMDYTGDVVILNEDTGVWDGGIWYSNESYKPWGYGAWDDPDSLDRFDYLMPSDIREILRYAKEGYEPSEILLKLQGIETVVKTEDCTVDRKGWTLKS